MKYFKYFVILFFILSCTKTVVEPGEKTIIGKWSFSSAKFNRILTTNSNQTAKLPYSGDGHLVVTGAINTILNGLIASRSESLKIYVLHIEYESYIEDALTIDDNTKIGTFISGPTEQTFTGPVDYVFNGTKLTINGATLINQDDTNNTINLSGEISFETMDINANNPVYIEIPAVQVQYPRRYMLYEFLEDGTFIRTINYDEGPETSIGTWTESGNEITTSIIEGDFTEIRTIQYSIEKNVLTAEETYDLCDASQPNSQCFNYYEGIYGIEEGSLTNIAMEATINFLEVNDIN